MLGSFEHKPTHANVGKLVQSPQPEIEFAIEIPNLFAMYAFNKSQNDQLGKLHLGEDHFVVRTKSCIAPFE